MLSNLLGLPTPEYSMYNMKALRYSSFRCLWFREFHDPPLPFSHSLNPSSTSRGMGIESRSWESLSLKQPGLEKMVVSELFLPWTRKIPSELPFSPCDNSRNQAATALGERLSFSWLLWWQRPWESWYFWPTLPTSYHPAQDSPSWTLVPPSLFLCDHPDQHLTVYFQISQTRLSPQIFIILVLSCSWRWMESCFLKSFLYDFVYVQTHWSSCMYLPFGLGI